MEMLKKGMINKMEWNTYEELQTLIDKDNKTLDAQTLYRKIQPALLYELEFAEDRIKQLEDNLDEDIYSNCLSSELFRKKQVKTTNSFLSGDVANKDITHHLEKLADYILYAKYDNQEHKNEIEHLKEEIRVLNKNKNKQTNKNKKAKIKRFIDDNHLFQENRKTRTNYQVVRFDQPIDQDNDSSESIGDYIEEGSPRVFYTWKDKQLNQSGKFKNSQKYWEYYSHNKIPNKSIFEKLNNNISYSEEAFKTIDELEKTSAYLKETLKEFEGRKNLSKVEKEINRSRQMRLQGTNSNLITAIEFFRNPVVLNKNTVGINDTMSQYALDILDYNNHNTIKIILTNYRTLKEKFNSKTGSSIWIILMDLEMALERLIKKNSLSQTQEIILNLIVKNDDFSYQQLKEELLDKQAKEFKDTTINYHINIIIKKLSEEMGEKNREI